MADFVAPQFQNPDMLGQFLRGQQGGQQAAAFPGQMQLQQQAIQGGQQDLTAGGLKLDQLRMAMKNQQMYQRVAQQKLQEDGFLGGQAAQPASGATGGVQNGPQASTYGATDNNWTGNTPTQTNVGGYSAGTLSALAMLRGDDPLKTAQGVQEYQQKQTQLQLQGPMSLAETVSSSPQADVLIRNNPSLQAAWIKTAPKMGLNPFTDLTPENARKAAIYGYNNLAGQAGLPPKPMPDELKTVQQGLGQSYQQSAVTGKISGGASAVPTDKFVIGGQVREMPKAQGVASGAQPYDSALYGADQISPQALEQAYQVSKQTGDLSQSLAGRDPIAAAKVSSYIAQRSKQDDPNGKLSMAAQQQSFKASQNVVNDYTDPSGKAGGKLQAINTVTEHAKALYPLIDAMGTGNTQFINKAKLAYQQQTGNSAPTSYQAMANIYAGELKTAVTQNGGDKDEREQISAPFSDINSPTQLKDAISISAKAMAGKTHALQKGWEVGTNGTQGPFDKFLTPATRDFLQGDAAASQHPPAIQNLLDKYKK